jgi:hypothetical protein
MRTGQLRSELDGQCLITLGFVEPLTAAERTIVLRALFELAITESGFDDQPDREERADHDFRPDQIADLVRKLGGDPDVPLFGADDLRE